MSLNIVNTVGVRIAVKNILHVIRSFLILNGCFFLPLVVTLCWSVAEKIRITVDVPTPTRIDLCVGDKKFAEYCGKDATSRNAVFSFPDGIPQGALTLTFSIPREKVTVVDIERRAHFFLRRRFLGNIGDTAKWSAPHLELGRKWAFRLCLLEFVLLFCAWIFRKIEVSSFRGRLMLSLLYAFHLMFFFAFLIPITTWIGNRDIFSFGCLELLVSIAPCLVFVFLTTFVILFVSSFFFDRLPFVLALSILVYEYLLTGILAAHIPPLDGNFEFLWEGVACWPDFLALFAVPTILFLSYRWIKPYLIWFSLVILILNVASIIDVSLKGSTNRHEGRFQYMEDAEIISDLRWSANTNVIVLVLDSARMDVASSIARKYPSIKNRFDGFLCFDNNLGMGPASRFGVPGIMTGKYYIPETDMMDYLDTQRQEGSYVSYYDQRGAAVYFRTDSAWLRYTNRSGGGGQRDNCKDHESEDCLFRRAQTVPCVNLFTVIRFRIVPNFWKSLSYHDCMRGIVGRDVYSFENFCYNVLASKPVDKSIPIALYHFHTNGVHLPHETDRNGNVVFSYRTPQVAEEEATFYVLKCLGDFMDALRSKNIYDNSLIVVLADHGNDGNHRKGDDGRKYPMLWVKPINWHGEMDHCLEPTSHERVSTLIKDAYDHARSRDEIVHMLTCPSRRFVSVDGLGREVPMDAK